MKMTVYARGDYLFTWEASDAEIRKLGAEFERLGVGAGEPPTAIANTVVQEIVKNGLPQEDPQRRGAMAWVAYFLLHTHTHRGDHPGTYADYVSAWDFEFDLRPHADGKCIDVAVLGDPFAQRQ